MTAGTNINTWLSIAGFTLTIGTGYVALRDATVRSEMRDAEQDRRIDAIELAGEAAADAIKAIQIAGATANAESTALRREMGELKENLRDTQAELREVANLLRAAQGSAE